MTFRVKDGLSINGALFVDTSTNVRAVSAVITGTSGATSAITGALQVAGGIGVAGGVFVGGTVTATTFVGAFAGAITGVATTATNLQNGTAGQVPYQTGAGATSFFGPGTSGQILVSAGTSAPTYTNTASIYVGNAAVANILNSGNTSTQLVGFAATAGVLLDANTTTQQVGFADVAGRLLAANTGTQYVGFANKSNNIIAGTTGQLVYQSAADTTGFVGPGTSGQILVSAGASAPTYTNTSSIYVNRATLADSATSAGALSSALTAGTGLTSSNGTFNGSAAVTFSLNTATYMSTAVTANNVAAGTAGQLVYQTGVGATGFAGPGTAGQLLMSAGASAPTYTNTSSIYVNSSVFAEDVRGGTTGQLVYQSGANVTDFVGPGTAGQILISAGTNAPVYTNTSSIYVNSAVSSEQLKAGTTGQVPYQTGVGATSFFGPGTAGQLLMSAGASAPTYTNTASIYVGNAAVANILNSGNTSTQYVGFANKSNNIIAGTAGQLVYQSAADTTGFVGPGTAGQLLMSAGASAPTYTNTSSIYVNSAVSSEKLKAGTTGAIAYQSAADTTVFLALSGTQKSLLTAGASAPTYVTQVQAQSGTGSATLATGQSLVVTGGGIGVTGDSYFANNVGVNGALTVNGTVTFSAGVTFSGGSTTIASTNTVYTDNIINLHTPPTGINTPWFVDDLKDVGFVFHYYKNSTDTNAALVLANDTKYLEWYSAGAEGTTGTIWNGTYGTFKTGNILIDNTTGATSAVTGALQVKGGVGVGGGLYVTGRVTATTFIGAFTGDLYGMATYATYADNFSNGTAGQVPYQTGVDATSFFGPGTAGQLLMSAGASAPTYTNTSSIYVNNAFYADEIRGGTTGQLVYQSGANVTDFVGPGTAGQILISAGASAPVYTNTSSIYVNRAVSADSAIGSAGSVANALTIGSGLGGTSYNGSSAVTITLTTSTLMTTAVTALSATGSAGSVANALTISSPLSGSSYNGSSAVSIGLSANYGDTQNPYASKTANYVLAAPNGVAGVPTFRAIVAADIPTLNQATTQQAGSVANALTIGTGLTGSVGTYNGSAAVTASLNTATLMATSVTALNGGVTSIVAGTAISVSGATGAVTVNNTGVTSNVAGTGVSVSGATGAVTISIGQAVATSSNVQFNSLGVGTAGSATAGEIRATNEITAYYSDRRLKENVKVIDNAVDKVLLLNGITYTPNEVAESFGYDRTVKLVGLFADEVEAVLPEATRPAPFDQDENGNSKSGENYKTIQYEKLVPLLIEAIKEQQKQIAQLSETINTLVNK